MYVQIFSRCMQSESRIRFLTKLLFHRCRKSLSPPLRGIFSNWALRWLDYVSLSVAEYLIKCPPRLYSIYPEMIPRNFHFSTRKSPIPSSVFLSRDNNNRKLESAVLPCSIISPHREGHKQTIVTTIGNTYNKQFADTSGEIAWRKSK